MNKKYSLPIRFFALMLIVLISLAFRNVGGDGGKTVPKTVSKQGDAFYMFVNNIALPMNKEGVLANVNIGNYPAGGRMDGKEFLYSGGFFISGKTNGRMWANAVASASRVLDYEAGTYQYGKSDPRNQIYVVEQKSGDFSQDWEDWKDAVALGAYFYDGDGDGVYNPRDLNGNGKWDPTEDRPDLIGDITAWCVFMDSRPPAQRRWVEVEPQGIEVRQSVFAFASKGVTGNMVFVRYSIMNTGLKADTLDDVYFGVWADPDLGNIQDAYLDDLVGCDTTLNAGYVYNEGPDNEWGINPPCFVIDFFQGPIAYIPGKSFVDANGNGVYDAGEVALDTAFNVQGKARGIAKFPGATNLGLSSFVHYMQSHPTQGDPANSTEARNYMLGLNRVGNPIDPCTWTFGAVRGNVSCSAVNNKFMYSGDPVTDQGWINIFATDQRQMSNTGPFKLIKGQPVDIVVAYVVGRGTDALNSITVAKEYDKVAQKVFDSNFPSPPAPPEIKYTVKNGPGFIDIDFPTAAQMNYVAIDTVLDIERRIHGYYVTAFKNRSKADFINGLENSKRIAEYQVDNFIKEVYQVAGNGGQNHVIKGVGSEFKLNPVVYKDTTTGRIRVRIFRDPFTGAPLIKGKEYYFSVTHYYLNYRVIVHRNGAPFGTPGEYLDPQGSAIEEFDTPLIVVTYGEDQYSPSSYGIVPEQTSGASVANIKIMPVDFSKLTGDEYTIEFFENNARPKNLPYLPMWRLKRGSTVLIDSSTVYDSDTTNFAGRLTDGFIVKIKSIEPVIGTPTYTANQRWYHPFSGLANSVLTNGVFYVGGDNPQSNPPTVGPNNTVGSISRVIGSDRLRRIELRFGTQGKAYRFISGVKGTALTRFINNAYAGWITASDTVGKGAVGNWNTSTDRANGFIDVPFTAWVVDPKFKEEKQLAVGILEYSSVHASLRGNPDGVWNPGFINQPTPRGNEAIFIFDTPYEPNGNNIIYTGGNGTYSGTNWPDIIRGYNLNDPNASARDKEIASSPFLNTIYVVALKRDSTITGPFNPQGTLTIPVRTYPYTSADKFKFKTVKGGLLSEDQQRELFNKVNVFPNPLFGFNPATSYTNSSPDEPFVTFSNLPEEVTIKIYTLSGMLIKTLTTADKSSPSSNFLRWYLKNEDGIRAASGLYIAIVSSPKFGEKILKFSIIMPQKQIERY
ncbi:MAG: hypothetical protein NZM09_07510 [Ignavibacterium sp.]|nr:hypothetical protein [Ignavibacterium sp.]MDW8375530.1 hypothetical protein [Ignavibacteriales bacterium]